MAIFSERVSSSNALWTRIVLDTFLNVTRESVFCAHSGRPFQKTTPTRESLWPSCWTVLRGHKENVIWEAWLVGGSLLANAVGQGPLGKKGCKDNNMSSLNWAWKQIGNQCNWCSTDVFWMADHWQESHCYILYRLKLPRWFQSPLHIAVQSGD